MDGCLRSGTSVDQSCLATGTADLESELRQITAGLMGVDPEVSIFGTKSCYHPFLAPWLTGSQNQGAAGIAATQLAKPLPWTVAPFDSGTLGHRGHPRSTLATSPSISAARWPRGHTPSRGPLPLPGTPPPRQRR